MDTALWIVQGLLAVAFLMAGVMKTFQPKEKLTERMEWMEDVPQGQIRAIGVLEILGAIGLILPAVTGILPWLTPLAALGLALTMVVAGWVHFRRKEYSSIVVNVVLLLLSLFVAYGRFVSLPM